MRNFFKAFLASCIKVRRSLLPGCKGGNVESKMNSVKGVPSSWSCQHSWLLEAPGQLLTRLMPSLSSHIDVPGSCPGMRSPMVKGKETPVELSTVVVIDLR